MPTPLHELIIEAIVEEIKSQLRSISDSNSQSAKFAKAVRSEGSSTVHFKDSQFGRHDPDNQFRHSEAYYPGIILEVAQSQMEKDLPYLADEYILGSDADIRKVICIKLYKETNKAILSIWEPRIVPNGAGEDELVAQQVVNESFRDEQGNPNQSANINLQLQHFAKEGLFSKAPLDPIHISAEKLCTILSDAMERATVKLEKTSQTTSPKRWARKRRREASSDGVRVT